MSVPCVYKLSEIRLVPPQGVEFLRGRVLVRTLTSWLAETRCDLIKGAAFGFWNFEVGEDEEAKQQDGEDDEDVWATELLHQRERFISVVAYNKLTGGAYWTVCC